MVEDDKSGVGVGGMPGMDTKVLTVFINKFLADGVKFLNEFCVNCEMKMSATARRLDRIEADLGRRIYMLF